jgi:hypothetical protein
MMADGIKHDDLDAVLNNLHFRDNTAITEDCNTIVQSNSILIFIFVFFSLFGNRFLLIVLCFQQQNHKEMLTKKYQT